MAEKHEYSSTLTPRLAAGMPCQWAVGRGPRLTHDAVASMSHEWKQNKRVRS